MNELVVKFSNFCTRVFVGQALCSQIGNIVQKKLVCECGCTVVIITDSVVFELFENRIRKSFLDFGFRVLTCKLGSGERLKSFSSFKKICNFLAYHRIKKTDLIVSVGGGVILDLAGFVSACFLRGLRLIHIPTTLLAMVDACIGGKSALNLKYGKNLVGCFKQPSLVFCNLSFVATLPQEQQFSAMAEVVKYAVLFSERFFRFLVGCGKCLSTRELETVVVECLKFKKNLIEVDEFDDQNERIKLNFGHTIGHALEAYRGYSKKLTHGQAVALGMSFCVRQGEKFGLTEAGEFERLRFVLEKFDLPTQIGTNVKFKRLYEICLNDKKIYGNVLNLVLVKKIGSCFVKKLSLSEFKRFLKA